MQTEVFNYQAIEKYHVDCPICGSANNETILASDRYEMGITTVICVRCGLLYTNPRPSSEVFNQFYENHYREFYEDVEWPSEKYIKEGRFTERASIVFEHLKKHIESEHFTEPVKILDVGCSEGSVLRFICKNSDRNIDAAGVEPSRNFSDFARGYTGGQVFNGSLEEFCQGDHDSKFDIIILNHVLEHFLDPQNSLQALHRLLSKDGILFIEVPNILGDWSGMGMFHIAHVLQFHEASLTNLLALTGFSPVSVSTRGNEIHPWAMTFICKKNSAATPQYLSRSEITDIKDTVLAKIKQQGSMPKSKGVFERIMAWLK